MSNADRFRTTTCDCKWCGTSTRMTGTQMCDSCWELDARINQNPALARRILESAPNAVCAEIMSIMRTYHQQETSRRGVDTPGGLEHMGDVWRLFLRWEQMLQENRHG